MSSLILRLRLPRMYNRGFGLARRGRTGHVAGAGYACAELKRAKRALWSEATCILGLLSSNMLTDSDWRV
ncbi:hypothetical protein [Blackfly microvirus SF02]|uniref:Uncharacterized protein n=1 Tax=Blackfly microvirus SF02 TaxID=2576452 RepID=A0A4P8PTS6_9VIRU|nr:hypothetical protein [Blackfly microvirus SF02]